MPTTVAGKIPINDILHSFFSNYQEFAYLNIGLMIAFYIVAFLFLENKISFKIIKSQFISNSLNLYLLSFIIMQSLRFIPADFLNSVPVRVFLLPRYVATAFYDATIIFVVFVLISQIPKVGKFLNYIFLSLLFAYILMAFTTFFHIKRLPSSSEFALGTQIFLVSPITYFIIALKAKPIQFVFSVVIPIVFIVRYIKYIDSNNLKIKLLSWKTIFIAMLMGFIVLGYVAFNSLIKRKKSEFNTAMFMNQNINRIGIFIYQDFLLKSNVKIKTDYNPTKLRTKIDEVLKNYPADKLDKSKAMPQVILNYASESFVYPERIDKAITNQAEINPTFKQLIKNGVANGVQSTFPLFGSGTVQGESVLLTNMIIETPKQNHSSLVSYYKDLGYTTIYVHIVFDTFYNYFERSKYYGFDEIYLGSHFKQKWGNDSILFPFIQKRIDEAIANNEKVFISFIDISKHGPYELKETDNRDELVKKYNTTDDLMLGYIKKSNIADSYLADLIDFINQKDIEIAMSICADHVAATFKAQEKLKSGEDKYLSQFLFYNNKRKLSLPTDYNYTYMHQSLVPSLFLKSLGMPLRPLDKYILDKSQAEKTYKLDLMKDMPYDISRGMQVSNPLFELNK